MSYLLNFYNFFSEILKPAVIFKLKTMSYVAGVTELLSRWKKSYSWRTGHGFPIDAGPAAGAASAAAAADVTDVGVGRPVSAVLAGRDLAQRRGAMDAGHHSRLVDWIWAQFLNILQRLLAIYKVVPWKPRFHFANEDFRGRS